jgi:hypothetical protein
VGFIDQTLVWHWHGIVIAWHCCLLEMMTTSARAPHRLLDGSLSGKPARGADIVLPNQNNCKYNGKERHFKGLFHTKKACFN